MTQSGWLYVYDSSVNLLGVCEAHNNTDSRSNGPYPPGSYLANGHNNHPPDPDGGFGSYGIYLFPHSGCPDCGVHSGRANVPDGRGRIGSQHATMGCIRTNDGCMEWLTLINAADPIRRIVIQ